MMAAFNSGLAEFLENLTACLGPYSTALTPTGQPMGLGSRMAGSVSWRLLSQYSEV